MRTYAWPLLAALSLIVNACGSDSPPNTDGGNDASGRGGSGAKGGSSGGAGRGGSGGAAGSLGGSGGATGGSGGATAGSGGAAGKGGATAGAGGATGGSAGGTGGSAAGTGGGGAGTGGSAGAGGATGGSAGGATAGTGGTTAGSAGSGGATGGSAGGATAGSGGATGGSGGTGGTGGTGTGVPCTDASTCPGGPDTECQKKTCLSNLCGLDFTAANTPVAAQTTGDCKQNVCDGLGAVMPAHLDSDTPADDGNACTAETCINGLPSHPAEPVRTACAQSGGTLCNGNQATPACVVCVAATDCPGVDSICHKRICGNQYTCGFSNAATGTAAEPDATGNCQKAVCDDVGGVTSAPDNTDVPADDGNACTDDVCASGAPAHPAKAAGTACSQNGGSFCSGTACVQCALASDCPGSDTICRQRTCDGSHVCGHMDAPQGTAAGTDAVGNCHKQVCDGAGTAVSVVDDTDVLVDGDPCTKDVCTSGTPSNPALPAGAVCAADGSKACAADGSCNTLTFRVVHLLGTSSAATAVAIDEYKSDGTMVGSISIAATASGANQPLTMSGSASSEGCLSLSGDGHYLALAGYGVTIPTLAVKGTTGKRIAGLVDLAGNINTSTKFDTGDTGDNCRGATTLDGVDVWISGAGSGTNGGIWYNQSGMTTGEQHVVSTPSNTRCVAIFGGQLYASVSSGAFNGVYKVGLSTPTTAGQSLNMPVATTANGYGFAMFDLDTTVSGFDTIYVADDAAGIQKWKSDGSSWTVSATAYNIAGATGFRGVAGYATGGTVTLMASTAETATNNRLVIFVIDNTTGAVIGTPVVVPATTGNFRGVAVSPHFPAP